MLREFAKKLKKNYGWSEADFILARPSECEMTGMKSLKWDAFLNVGLPRSRWCFSLNLISPPVYV
jgi:hypothetical protein